jgi:hypothetical protein
MPVSLAKPALAPRDRTRTPAAKARTISKRTARRLRIAHNAAVLLGIIAFADDTATAPVLAR